jgi:acetylornithine/N-succinyldiaminopimelate aminotransferase
MKPDVVTLAKALAGGLPAGAFLAGERAAEVLQIGDHGSTFGGNSLAAAAGLVVLDTVAKPDFLKEIVRKGNKIQDALKSWKHPKITEVRGKGMMIGADISEEAWPLLETAIKQPDPGLLLLTAGKQTLRFLPPYIINDQELDQGLEILKSIL